MNSDILERLTKIEITLDDIQKNTNKMSEHIDHINNIQEALKPTIDYFKNLKIFNSK